MSLMTALGQMQTSQLLHLMRFGVVVWFCVCLCVLVCRFFLNLTRGGRGRGRLHIERDDKPASQGARFE
jgi:hypothetical protein